MPALFLCRLFPGGGPVRQRLRRWIGAPNHAETRSYQSRRARSASFTICLSLSRLGDSASAGSRANPWSLYARKRRPASKKLSYKGPFNPCRSNGHAAAHCPIPERTCAGDRRRARAYSSATFGTFRPQLTAFGRLIGTPAFFATASAHTATFSISSRCTSAAARWSACRWPGANFRPDLLSRPNAG